MRISDWSSDVCSSDLEVAEVPAAAPELTVAFALVKGDKPELVVQKLTELGIDRIEPLRAERSVVRWDEAKAASALTRLRARSEERRVGKECGRTCRSRGSPLP